MSFLAAIFSRVSEGSRRTSSELTDFHLLFFSLFSLKLFLLNFSPFFATLVWALLQSLFSGLFSLVGRGAVRGLSLELAHNHLPRYQKSQNLPKSKGSKFRKNDF